MKEEKLLFQGKIISVQPRIKLKRSFDQRSHTYSGYVIIIDGEIDKESKEFSICTGKVTLKKYGFKYGDQIKGRCLPVKRPEKEPGDYYKVSALKLIKEAREQQDPPPWTGVPPVLKEYRQRGHMRLDKQTYDKNCIPCIWGCLMPVEIILDQWNTGQREYRTETFCYGPKSCEYYKAGPRRKVPGRNGMVWEEPDWVDEENTSHRGPDE